MYCAPVICGIMLAWNYRGDHDRKSFVPCSVYDLGRFLISQSQSSSICTKENNENFEKVSVANTCRGRLHLSQS